MFISIVLNTGAKMAIQIFGTKKCKTTKKAQRFFSERNISFQFIDIAIKGPSKGELNSILKFVPLDEIIDKHSKLYEKKNFKYIQHDILEEILNEPLLLNTPIVRCGQLSVQGLDEEKWKIIVEKEKA